MSASDLDTHVLLRAFTDELVRSGVQHACTSPGSRSTPLVLALVRDGRLRVHSHVDERALDCERSRGRREPCHQRECRSDPNAKRIHRGARQRAGVGLERLEFPVPRALHELVPDLHRIRGLFIRDCSRGIIAGHGRIPQPPPERVRPERIVRHPHTRR